MIDSLSIWLSSGGTDILGLRLNSRTGGWFCMHFAHIFRRTPTGWMTRLIYDCLAHGLKKWKIPWKNKEKKYQCPKWRKLFWGLYERARTGAVSRINIFFRERCDLFKELKVCCYALIGESGAILQRTCQFWEPSMWRRYLNYFPWQGTENHHGQEILKSAYGGAARALDHLSIGFETRRAIWQLFRFHLYREGLSGTLLPENAIAGLLKGPSREYTYGNSSGVNSWRMIRILLIPLGDVILNRKISDRNIYISWKISLRCFLSLLNLHPYMSTLATLSMSS